MLRRTPPTGHPKHSLRSHPTRAAALAFLALGGVLGGALQVGSIGLASAATVVTVKPAIHGLIDRNGAPDAVVQYGTLSRALNQAELATQTAQSRVITASGDLADANAAPLIGEPTATLVSAKSTRTKAVAIAGGLGLVLGLALVLFVEFLRATRRPRPVMQLPAGPSSMSAPTPSVRKVSPRS